MTPDTPTPDPEALDSIPRPSRRATVLGAIGALVATVAVATVGFVAAPVPTPGASSSPVADGTSTQNGQLGTLPLHDEKGMRAIGKGVVPPGTPAPTPTVTPAP